MPGARLLGEVVGQPRQALLGRAEADHAESQRLAVERALSARTSPSEPALPSCSATSWDPGVRGGRVASTGMPVGRSSSSVRSAGSRAGSRGPSRRCSAPRRPPAGRRWRPAGAAPRRGTRVVESLGLTSSTSTSPARTASWIGSQLSMLVELMVTARMPARSAAAIWLRIRASSGDTMTVGPAPALAQQQGRDEVDRRLAPQPVRCTTSARRRSTASARSPPTGPRAGRRRRTRRARAGGPPPPSGGRGRPGPLSCRPVYQAPPTPPAGRPQAPAARHPRRSGTVTGAGRGPDLTRPGPGGRSPSRPWQSGDARPSVSEWNDSRARSWSSSSPPSPSPCRSRAGRSPRR